MISAAAVSTVTLTLSGTNPWTVFDASTLATGGNLQANWNDLASQLNNNYKPLLNSAVNEIGVLEAASGAEYIGISGLSGMATGTSVYTALTQLNSTASTLNTRLASATADISAVSSLLSGFSRATTSPTTTTTSIGFEGCFYATKVFNAVYK
jgi:hypothetical protein